MLGGAPGVWGPVNICTEIIQMFSNMGRSPAMGLSPAVAGLLCYLKKKKKKSILKNGGFVTMGQIVFVVVR